MPCQRLQRPFREAVQADGGCAVGIMSVVCRGENGQGGFPDVLADGYGGTLGLF
jgi:hypothetical protein